MKLHTRIWTLVLGVMSALLALILGLGGWVFVSGRQASEQQEIVAQARRIEVLLDQELQSLVRVTNDYAFWIDSVAYVHGQKPEYETDNFAPSSVENLAVNMILAFRPDGMLAGGVVRDTATGALRKATVVDAEPFRAEVLTLQRAPERSPSRSGLLLRDGQLVLTAAAQIRTEESPGTAGIMVFVRPLGDELLKRFSVISGGDVAIEAGPALADNFDDWRTADQSRLRFLDLPNDRIRIRVPLHNADGGEVGTALLEIPVPARREARETAAMIAGVLVVSCLCIGWLLTLVLRRKVVRPLERLTGVLVEAGASEELTVRAPVTGGDEIADLSRGFNDLMDKLVRGRKEREHAQLERERLQTQLLHAQKMEAVGEFAGGIAHDFNNTLTSITGWISFVRETLPPNHEVQDGLSHAMASADHAGAVVAQLLAYSRHGATTLTPLSVGELLGGSRALLRAGLPRSVDLQVSLLSEVDTIMADRTQVLQVVLNLVKNSADAMNGKGRINVAVTRLHLPAPDNPGAEKLSPGPYVKVSVSDNGPGIAPAILARVFEPFFTTKTAGKGTGLGLAVVQNVALRHGGGVGVASPPGEGATFHVYFPSVAASPAAKPVGASGTGRRVLVVEDDASVMKIVLALLQKRGYTTFAATNGEEGWRAFEAMAQPPDVVLTDVTMPVLGGLQLGERIFNCSHPTPVVLMTAFAATLDIAQLRSAGFAGLVSKPINFDELLATLAQAKVNPAGPSA